VLRDVLRRRRQLLGEDHPQVLKSMQRLGHLLWMKRSYDEAEQVLRAAVAQYRRVLGDRHPDTLATTAFLAGVRHNQGDLRDSEALYRTAIDTSEKTAGPNADSAAWQGELASVLADNGDNSGAAQLYAQALATCRAKLGWGSVREAGLLAGLGALHLKTGALWLAEAAFDEALAIRQQRLGPSHMDVASSLADLAGLRSREGKVDEAERLYREALEIDRRNSAARIQTAAHLAGLNGLLAGRGESNRGGDPVGRH